MQVTAFRPLKFGEDLFALRTDGKKEELDPYIKDINYG